MNSLSPKFSVIVPLYNKEQSLYYTLHSILSQSYQDYEIVVVDDGSTDKSASIVNSIIDDRIIFIQQSNRGVSAARNQGLRISKGQWIYFFDADDIMSKDALQHFASLIERYPNILCFVGNTIHPGNKFRSKIHNNPQIISNPYRAIWKDEIALSTGSYIFSRAILPSINYFDEKLSFFEDLAFYYRILDKYPVVSMSDPVMEYKMEYSSLSGSNHPIEREFAYYLTSTILKGGTLWRELFFAENVRYCEYIRSLEHDEYGVSYYKKKFYELFSWKCRFIFYIIDFRKRLVSAKNKFLYLFN